MRRRYGQDRRTHRQDRLPRAAGMGHFAAGLLLLAGVATLIVLLHPLWRHVLDGTAQGMVVGNQQVFQTTQYAQYTSQASCTQAGGVWDSGTGTCS